jgi:CO/xanthine dehydrogenase Mo-binding subunit
MRDDCGWAVDRRRFLGAGGAVVVAFAGAGLAAPAKAARTNRSDRPPSPTALDSYIAVTRDNRCTAFLGKVDVGQGLQVAIAQIVAEELDMPLERVDVVLGDTDRTVDHGGASGSYGISRGGQTLRLAAAEARRILVERAATVWGVGAEAIETSDGFARTRSAGRQISYGELVGDELFETKLAWNGTLGNRLKVSGLARPKDPSSYKIVGTSPPREDLHQNVFGRQRYVTNVRVPGMLHARVVRPPRTGAVLINVDPASVARFSARVVNRGGILAVLAEREWDAVRAAGALAVTWSEPPPAFPEQSALYDFLRTAQAEKVQVEVDDSDTEPQPGETLLEATYEWPFQSHASMVGACAVADVGPTSAIIWSGTQKPHAARAGIAGLLKLPPEDVRVIWVRGPGSYGRNDAGDAALEAAFLSREVGRPVRLQYTRAQGTSWDPKAPASIELCEAVLTPAGKVRRLTFTSRGFSRLDVAPAEADPRDTLVGQLLGMPANPQPAFAIPDEPYAVASRRLAWEVVPALAASASPLRTAHMRDPVGLQINFASESFWDEMAHAAGADPVDFRLRHLEEPRAIAVLRAAADLFGWGPRAATADRGRGIALGARADTVCAVAVEIEVDRASGWIRPVRYAVAHDCGLIVNPETLRRVIEGNLVQATSRSLLEEVTFDRYTVTSRDWRSYPVADVRHLPDRIEIALIDRPELPPGGAGEPASRPVPAALANALFDATGVRLRRAPLSPARVAAALV